MRGHAQSGQRKLNRHWQSGGGSPHHKYVQVIREQYVVIDTYLRTYPRSFYETGFYIALNADAVLGTYKGQAMSMEIELVEEMTTALGSNEYYFTHSIYTTRPTPDTDTFPYINYYASQNRTVQGVDVEGRFGASVVSSSPNSFSPGDRYRLFAYVTYWKEI